MPTQKTLREEIGKILDKLEAHSILAKNRNDAISQATDQILQAFREVLHNKYERARIIAREIALANAKGFKPASPKWEKG